MKCRTVKTILLTLSAALLLLAGCAAQAPVHSKRYVWPRPPDQARIEWLKSFYADGDFPKDGFSQFMEAVVGKGKVIVFEKPIDVKSNGKGLVFVTDIVVNGIFRFDLNAKEVEFWPKGTDPDKSIAVVPYYIALDSNDNLYVAGTGNKNVYVVDNKGVFLRKFSYDGKVAAPGGMLVDNEKKRLYLVDSGDAKVAIFDLDGNFISAFGKLGEGEGEFNRPIPVAQNSKGELLVGDTMNSRIQIFDRNGKFLRKFGQRGDGSADFQIIKGIGVDSDDNIYVTDAKANQIKIFSINGEYLMTFGATYSVTDTMKEAPGGFLLPQGIFIDKNDTIYIADQANMRFQMFKYLKEEPKKELPAPVNKVK